MYMKKWMVFVLGIVTGFILTIAIGFALNGIQNPKPSSENITESEQEAEPKEDDGITWFEEPGDIIEESSFKVIQVLAKDAALVCSKSKRADLYTGPVYLLTNGEGKYYYDDQIIKIPKEKAVRQMGIYRYPNKNEDIKTVPIIEIMDK